MNNLTITFGGSVELLLQPPQPQPMGACYVSTFVAGISLTAKGNEMAYTLPDDRMVTVRVDYVDAAGHPANVDGDVTWDTSAADVAAVEVEPGDSRQCSIKPGANLGTAQVTATADADLGGGVRQLVTTLDVTVVAGEAVAGVISPVGDAQPVPPPAPNPSP